LLIRYWSTGKRLCFAPKIWLGVIIIDLNEIIKRIGIIRTRANLSARELSLRIDKSEAYINRLEYRKNFEPSIGVLNDIINVCNSSHEEFFYYNIHQHKADKEIIDLLKNASDEKKRAIIALLKQ